MEAAGFGAPVLLKLDLLQPTGSFKARGAASLVTSLPDRGATSETPAVIAASGGNFGQAVAWAAGQVGREAEIFVPSTSPEEKIAPIRAWGARVHVVDGYYDAALRAAQRHRETTGGTWAHAYDQREVVAGQGTVAVELVEQTGGFDTVLVACGGGGLLAGVASYLRDEVRVIAVETEGTPTLHRARRAGQPVDVEVGGLAASALGARRVGRLAWAAQRWVDDALLVSDEEVVVAQRRLWDRCRLVAEPGGATALAALTSRRYIPEDGERLAVLVCGGNTDPSTVAAARHGGCTAGGSGEAGRGEG